MRKVKFRGKNKNGEWLYGDILQVGNEVFIAPTEGDWFDFIPWSKNNVFHLPVARYAVNPETVGQFTGLYDKNGTEIYEGDIYRYKEPDSINEVSYCIGGGFAGFDLSPTYHDENRLLDVEILGNIHDNANLLYSD